MQVLIVDDNQDITDLLSKFLKSKGFEIVVTNDPRDGLELIKEKNYDAVLLDISMPGFSGEQIIKTLATNEVLKDQHIFIFSANLNNEFIIKDFLRRDGINGCIEKPMNLHGILKTITS